MRLELLELLRALSNSLTAEETMADHLAGLAEALRQAGDANSAEAALSLARQHRVKALEIRGKLAALGDRYSGSFHLDL